SPVMAIMDIRLIGRPDGIEAALEIFRETGIRCIFATAHHDARMRARAEAALPLGWLPKPFAPHALVAMVKRALAQLETTGTVVPPYSSVCVVPDGSIRGRGACPACPALEPRQCDCLAGFRRLGAGAPTCRNGLQVGIPRHGKGERNSGRAQLPPRRWTGNPLARNRSAAPAPSRRGRRTRASRRSSPCRA